ncbi:MAG: hypothetical protein DWQ07_05560 [Chloroflexi bacterium]|nr:MAG: hypothetical protein DWQ07_05560 [Chloroflexota bacterium]MBL1194898.1 hypothetical protein [Chloroflexota bacterium]NOH12189.1 ArsB/NhaD family transporter [Chloroflexota bacterium]
MNFLKKYRGLLVFGLSITIWLLMTNLATASSLNQGGMDKFIISGYLLDPQGQPIAVAVVEGFEIGGETPLGEAESHEDGSYLLELNTIPASGLEVHITRAHYQSQTITLDSDTLNDLETSRVLNLGELTLERRVTPGFWAAAVIFVAVLALIAFELVASTTAALFGFSMVMVMSHVVNIFAPSWYIVDFEHALEFINWEVIFLVMAMMIIVAIIERTGIFQWTAFQAYRLSRGRTWLLVLILMAVTVVASALLDNFTTMLLMTPISIQIGLALGINPLALIIPEVLASNVGGITTLIGTPTNILIGAYADIGFTDFLINQTVGVTVALILMAAYVLWHYRAEWRKHAGGISETLYATLEKNAELKDPGALWKAGIVFVGVLIGFVLGENFHIVPAVPALIGATVLLIWLRPDIHSTIQAVDWTTLVFFMALFIVVGAVQEVGLIGFAAAWMADVIGDSLPLGIFVIVFGTGTLSILIANIPLAASMLPIVEFLSGSIPGANSKVLYYALSMGAAMGGNGTLIGAEANLVTAGITNQADTPISFLEFLKVGLPVTFLTLLAGFVWLLIRF